jgi:glycosyltransferase involved in cell wall biosynthesis
MAAPRVAIIKDSCIPTYRRPFFEQLAKATEREYVVFHGAPEPDSAVVAAEPPFHFQNVWVKCRFFRVFGRSVVYQPIVARILFGNFSAVVIGHEIKYVAYLVLLVGFRLLGKPVIFWGQGRTKDPKRDRRSALGHFLTRVVRAFKSLLLRASSGYMAYSELGARYIADAGMRRDRITVLWNTIDMTAEIAACERARQIPRAEIRRQEGIAADAVVLTFLGRLYAPKRADLLLAIVDEMRRDDMAVEAMIIGSGPAEAPLRATFESDAWCHFLGPVYDADRMARALRASDAVVIPDNIGLAVNQAFAHGLPVITCRSNVHGPEIEYVTDDRNGMIVEGDAGLRAGLGRFVQSHDLRARLAEGAMATRSQLRLERMVENFDAAVAKALKP